MKALNLVWIVGPLTLQMQYEVVEEIIYGLESGILFGYCHVLNLRIIISVIIHSLQDS